VLSPVVEALQNERALKDATIKGIHDQVLRLGREQKFSGLRRGMTLDEVEAIIGPADSGFYGYFRRNVQALTAAVNKINSLASQPGSRLEFVWGPKGLTGEHMQTPGNPQESSCSWTDEGYSLTFDGRGELQSFSLGGVWRYNQSQ
jgi:hypothetical protein